MKCPHCLVDFHDRPSRVNCGADAEAAWAVTKRTQIRATQAGFQGFGRGNARNTATPERRTWKSAQPAVEKLSLQGNEIGRCQKASRSHDQKLYPEALWPAHCSTPR